MNVNIMASEGTATHELNFRRHFAAPPAKVFAAWTDPALLVGWWGPEGMNVPEYDIDLREGGAWRTVMQNSEGGQHIVGGTYREIDPPRRLVMTWAWEEGGTPGPATLIEIDLEPDGHGTMMSFRHSGFEVEDWAHRHSHGWASSLSCLDAFIAEGNLK